MVMRGAVAVVGASGEEEDDGDDEEVRDEGARPSAFMWLSRAMADDCNA